MANDRLRYEISADTKGFVSAVGKAEGSVKGLGTGRGKQRSGAAMNQIAYAIDDMQYGFRGVQNNLQQIAVQAGASGPVVLALTALAVGINYVIEHWQDFQTETQKAIKDAQDFASAIAKDSSLGYALDFYSGILKDSASSTDAKTWALEQLKKNGYDPAKQSLDDFLKSKKKEIALNAADAVYQEKLAKATDKYAEAAEKRLEIEELQRKYDSLPGKEYTITPRGETLFTEKGNIRRIITRLNKDVQELESEGGDIIRRTNAIYRRIIDSLNGQSEEAGGDAIIDDDEGIPGLISNTVADIKKQFDLGDKELASAFDSWIRTGESGVAGLNAVFDDLDTSVKVQLLKTTNTVTQAGQAFQSAVASAFSGIGQDIGEVLAGDGEIGEKFLKTLGKFMQSFGSALVAVGVAEAAWLASWEPASKIAAGIGLIVAGSALAASYKKKPGGGATTSSTNTRQATSLGAYDRVQGGGPASPFGSVVRADQIRYVNQIGEERYNFTGN